MSLCNVKLNNPVQFKIIMRYPHVIVLLCIIIIILRPPVLHSVTAVPIKS